MNILYILFALTYFNQGINNLASQPLYFYLRENLGLSVPTIMWLGSLSTLPWMVKPVYGWISDSFPLFSYKRKSYIILSCIISVGILFFIGISPILSLPLLMSLIVLESLGGAFDDVCIDGIMVERGKELNETGRFQSIQWGALYTAQILTGISGGYIAQHYNYKTAYLIIAIFPLLISYFAFRYPEPKAESKKSSLGLGSWLKALSRRQFLLSALFLFCLWFSPSIGTPLMDKMRNGLHFSKIWIGWLETIGAVCSLMGALLYFKFSKGINIKKWLIWGTLLSAISTFAYLYLTRSTVLWYTLLFGVSGSFIQLILLDYMARACPDGTEATTFALLCSVVNFGTFCSKLAGGALFKYLGYNGLVVVSGIATLLCLLFIPFLEMKYEENHK
jgi:MFS family permease